EYLAKAKRELHGHHVSDEKRAALRFADYVQPLGELPFYFRSRKITGKLLPKRHVYRLEQFENFSGQHSLSGQAGFFREREFRRIASFHKTRKHFFQLRGTRPEFFV